MSYLESLESAQASLLNAREEISVEISAYPTPISGCDAQFTHLLSERRKIAKALAALDVQPFVATPRMMEAGAGVESR